MSVELTNILLGFFGGIVVTILILCAMTYRGKNNGR